MNLVFACFIVNVQPDPVAEAIPHHPRNVPIPQMSPPRHQQQQQHYQYQQQLNHQVNYPPQPIQNTQPSGRIAATNLDPHNSRPPSASTVVYCSQPNMGKILLCCELMTSLPRLWACFKTDNLACYCTCTHGVFCI